MFCAILYHVYNSKNVKNTHGGVILLVKLQDSVCKFTESITPPWVFFMFIKLDKWYKIAQSVPNVNNVPMIFQGSSLMCTVRHSENLKIPNKDSGLFRICFVAVMAATYFLFGFYSRSKIMAVEQCFRYY